MSADTLLPVLTDLPLLFGDEDHDERFEGVQLLDWSVEGDWKKTAERMDTGWRVREWEQTDSGDAWFCRWYTFVSDRLIGQLASIPEPPK